MHIASAALVTISGLTITNGVSAIRNPGGGILQDEGSMVLSNCVISGCTGSSYGGGLSISGTVRLVSCSIVHNKASGPIDNYGGGISSDGSLEMVNCTVAENSASWGGGLDFGGAASLTNCTIVGNRAYGYQGGGMLAGAVPRLRNTLIAGNITDDADEGPDCSGAVESLGFNFVGKIDGSSGWGALGDQVGTAAAPLVPYLGPLRNIGGGTLTMAPLLFPISPLVDQGSSSGIALDQRGRARSHEISYIHSVPPGGDRSDIGAYEISPISLFVTNTNDSGHGSLRETIAQAAPVDGDTVAFAPDVGGTITLTSGELLLTNDLNIVGPGPRALSISVNNASRVFHTTKGHVMIAELTITKGTNSGLGGGIFNEGKAQLTVSNCLVTANSALRGGGIANTSVLNVFSSSIVSNTASGISPLGGGVYNSYSGWIQNCTISGNEVPGAFESGGGVWNNSTASFGLSLYFSTVVSNVAGYTGGGVGNANTGNSIIDPIACIIAGNSAFSAPDVFGPYPYGSFNLIGESDGSTGLTNGVNYNYTGSIAAPLDQSPSAKEIKLVVKIVLLLSAIAFVSMVSGAIPVQNIVILGDSISAGYGVEPDEAYPSLLQEKIDRAGLPYRIINGGVSGDTSAGGLRRIDWLMRQPIDILVLELGGNDGLRGISPDATYQNLQGIIDKVKKKFPELKILIAGMKMPESMGVDYVRKFQEIFSRLAEKNKTAFLPFLLEGVGGKPELNQPDRIHPTSAGHKIVAENVWRALQPLLQKKKRAAEARS
jgi:acyl-CoA thioesterase-1